MSNREEKQALPTELRGSVPSRPSPFFFFFSFSRRVKPLPHLRLTFSRGEDENRVGHDGQVKVKRQMKAPAFIADHDASGSFGRAKGRTKLSGRSRHLDY